MITLNQTPGNDKDAIMVLRIDLDGEYMYFSDTFDKITLDGVDFDGKVILYDSVSEIESGVDISLGGGIGQVGNFSFAIARYTSYTNGVTTFEDFFNDFYPVAGKPLLTSKSVSVGIIWAGATTLAQITWPNDYYIEDVPVRDNAIYLSCIEFAELDGKQLPYYVVQKDNDNGISYYPNLPQENYSQPIPVVYGAFNSLNPTYSVFGLAPAVKVSRAKIYKASSHINYASNGAKLYKYIEPVKNILELTSAGGTYANDRSGYQVNLSASRTSRIDGLFKFQPLGLISGGNDVDYAIDEDSATYATIAPNDIMKWQMGADLSESDVGQNTGIEEDAVLIIEWDTAGGSVDFEIKYYHPNMGVNSGYSSLVASGTRNGTGFTDTYGFGQGNYNYGSNPKKYDDTAAWSWEELKVLEFHIINKNTSVGIMRIKNIYFQFDNLRMYEIENRGTFSWRDRPIGERGYPESKVKIPIFDSMSSNPIFVNMQGYTYDTWVS